MSATKAQHEEQAWLARRHEVGREMHDGWKRQKIANGFADHPFEDYDACRARGCTHLVSLHHPDMVDWDELPPHQQALNYAGGEIPFRLGYRAGVAAEALKLASGRFG